MSEWIRNKIFRTQLKRYKKKTKNEQTNEWTNECKQQQVAGGGILGILTFLVV